VAGGFGGEADVHGRCVQAACRGASDLNLGGTYPSAFYPARNGACDE
jgi:hypothetical protein